MKSIKHYIFGALLMLLAVVIFRSCYDDHSEKQRLEAETALITQQISNVSKLVVTEMTYAKVYTYENTKSYGWEYFVRQESTKSALIISNAKAQIAYDLKELKYEIDPDQKTIYLTYLPEPELKIDPNLTFYKMDNGFLNSFNASDINTIKKQITTDLRKQINASPVMDNAQNRLLSELSGIYLVTNSMGWTLIYNDTEVNSTKEMGSLLP
ncbi:DUF4230 domain-containing protein [Nonlabens xiamenensis]|uniref:DUF4230 domain-containing protein n=1 Tax=Nonlabens xiamenensis TaxID=2341043 RepID=UPI001F0B8E5F|nr:DUF4230 domain-containing protein [Nonlabens xiamenensis]